MTSTLKDKTIELLRNRPATLKLATVAADLNIPEGWLKVFARSAINEPSVVRVQAVYEYLTKTKLKV